MKKSFHLSTTQSPPFSTLPTKKENDGLISLSLTELHRASSKPTSNTPNEEILACSSGSFLNDKKALGKRELLSDKKTPLEHLRPRQLIFNAIRVTILQSGHIFTTFFTDQLESEKETEDLLISGQISENEADEMNEEWEKREWSIRWKEFPQRTISAFLKLQGATLFMRFYEYIASILVSKKTLDKLTKDPFKSAQRKSQRLGQNTTLGTKMFWTCLWANAISFLSDYTVQQCILVGGYWMYYKQQRRRAIQNRKDKGEGKEESISKDDEEDIVHAGGIGMSFALRSSSLLASKSAAWVVSSAAGAAGTVIFPFPGWNTLFGTQCGDAFASAFMDG